MNNQKFLGPLFIIGLGRSGTKLLRDLLNRNPQIGIPTAETAFIPTLVRRFGNPPNFSESEKAFDRFYKVFQRTSFYWYMEKEGYVLQKDQLFEIVGSNSWSDIFETIFRYYAPEEKDGRFIWGDKTPGLIHLRHADLLKRLYPEAKFLHIIRDPRDVCLSTKRTYGKSLFRTAYTWRIGIEISKIIKKQYPDDYKDIYFEDLIERPEAEMMSICRFLGCDFIPEMIELARPAENYGAAKGKVEILASNKNKYISGLSESQIRRIEEIVYYPVKHHGYKIDSNVKDKRITPWMLKLYEFHDLCATVYFDIREKGLLGGLRYFYKALTPYL